MNTKGICTKLDRVEDIESLLSQICRYNEVYHLDGYLPTMFDYKNVKLPLYLHVYELEGVYFLSYASEPEKTHTEFWRYIKNNYPKKEKTNEQP